GDLLRTFREKYAHDTVVALSSDGKTLAVADSRYQRKEPRWLQTLRLIDVATGEQRQLMDAAAEKGPRERTSALIFAPDGKSLVVSTEKGFRVWDVKSGKPTRAFPGGGIRLHFPPDGRRLLAAGSVLRVWDFETGKELHPPAGPKASADSLAFAPDGKTLASSGFGDRKAIT